MKSSKPDAVSAIILFAHGARDPEWSEPFYALKQAILKKQPQLIVEVSFLELMTPNLEAAIHTVATKGAKKIHIIPIFLAQGNHLKRDLPRLLQSIQVEYPSLEIKLASPIGEVKEILNTIADYTLKIWRNN